MKKRIKIIRLQSRICIGGPALHTELLSRYLIEGYKNVLIGGAVEKGEFSKYEQLKRSGIDVRIIDEMHRSTRPFADLRSLYYLYRTIKAERPMIVCTHTAKAGAIGRIAAVLAGVPLVFHTFHGHVFDHYFSPMVSFIFLTIERVLARFTTTIIAISPAQLEELTAKFHVAPQSRFAMIRLGFELDLLSGLEKSGELKKRYMIPQDALLIGVIGRLVPIKNIPAALMILKELHQHNKPYHLLIVGDGTERSNLEDLCEQLELASFVHFTGWVQNMSEIYRGLDLLLLTSLNEGTPVTIIEAMAAGVPVVASNVGGVPDLIVEGETGRLFDVNDLSAGVSAIEKMMQDSILRDTIVQNAFRFVQLHYHYRRLIREMDALYKLHLEKLQ
ncbi:MAG: glycosyltransferase family 1 protein [Calditrichaeota bacterium]|nr:MAG: glycosyltransferase family 1 protein [Calditrichota bacterium]